MPRLVAQMERIESLLKAFEKPRHSSKFLTLKQTAEELNLCVKSVRRLIDRGLLKTQQGNAGCPRPH